MLVGSCRNGEITANAVQSQFAQVLGTNQEASGVLLELAYLLPDDQQGKALADAAARRGDSSTVLPDSAKDMMSANKWQPMDRSRISAAADELAIRQTAAAKARDCMVDERIASSSSAESSFRPAINRSPRPAFDQVAQELHKDVRGPKRQRGSDTRHAVGGHGCHNAAGVLVWVRQDMRIHDNSPLVRAAEVVKRDGGHVTIVHIHSPDEDGDDYQSGESCL